MPDNVSGPEILPRRFAPTECDRRYWQSVLRSHGQGRALKLLKRIEAERALGKVECEKGSPNAKWLLKYRAEFHWAIQYSLLEPIKLYLSDCRPEMIPLGVWLWGRCADRFRLYGLSAFCDDPSPRVRREAAKALRRVEAWALLREMAEANRDDARIQWFATAPTSHRPFAERLKDFASSVDDSHAGEVFTPSRMPFWALERAWERTPPKSVAIVRRMLRRIRHWVRWGVS